MSRSPLDAYRRQAKFTVEQIQDHFDDKQCIEMRNKIWNTLQNDPLFSSTEEELTGQMPLDKQRHLAHLRAKKLCDYQFVTIEDMLDNPLVGSVLNNAVGMFDWNCITRYLLHLTVCIYHT